MPSNPTRLDPQGYYARLGVDPAASPEAITAAFRRAARRVHPDVPVTGNADAFVAVRKAYDALSNRERRAIYDRSGQEASDPLATDPLATAFRPATPSWQPEPAQDPDDVYFTELGLDEIVPVSGQGIRPRRRSLFADVPLPVWIGLAVFLCIGVVEVVMHLRPLPSLPAVAISPNAAFVQPLSPSAHRDVLYGPPPVRLAGTPNFYIAPSTGPAVLWRRDQAHGGAMVPETQLPAFSAVQAIRLFTQNGLVEVLYKDSMTGFIDAKRLTPGDANAAHRAYCGYNAGATPTDGERLEQRGQGSGNIAIDNNAVEPTVVKLRDGAGAVALSVFLGPNSHVQLSNLPAGTFRADFAVGELWSRACNSFAAGMRARRLATDLTTPPDVRLVLPLDDAAAAPDIPDQDFEKD